MARIRIRDTLLEKVLVSREAAKLVTGPLRRALAQRMAEKPEHERIDVVIDFDGVEGIAPSFMDELIEVAQSEAGSESRIQFLHPPTRLSLRFEAVIRSRGLKVAHSSSDAWNLEPIDETARGQPPRTQRTPRDR